MQSHLQPIHVVVQFLEGTGCQLLFPPGLGSSLLLCGGLLYHMCRMSHTSRLQTLPSPNTEPCHETSLLECWDTALD